MGINSQAYYPVREAPEEQKEYQVRKIIDSRREGHKLQYRVYWQGYNKDKEKIWEPAANLWHLKKKLHEFHWQNPGKPGLRGLYKA